VSGNEEASVPESACGDGTVRFAIFSKENGRDSVAVERRTETSALLAVSLPFLFHNLCFLFFFYGLRLRVRWWVSWWAQQKFFFFSSAPVDT
jgi:hypothetical protein